MPFLASSDTANYHWSFLFLVPCLWIVFAIRRPLRLHTAHFALFALALILHNLGALGFYKREFLWLAFDTYVHSYYSLVGAFILERAFRAHLRLHGVGLWVGVTVFLLGLAAIHEMLEVGSTLVLGDAGMFKRNSSDEFDTQKDLCSGLVGSLVGLGLASLQRRIQGARAKRSALARNNAGSWSREGT